MFYQSNHEGEIITYLQNLKDGDRLILNAASLTHTSVGIRDALAATKVPFVEVHISNVYAREEFRHKSYLSAIASGVIVGLGAEGYLRIAEQLLSGIDRYRRELSAIPGLFVVGEPDLAIVAYGSHDLDAFAIATQMAQRGWQPGLLRRPRAVHRMMSMLHIDSMAPYLDDLRWAVSEVRARPSAAAQPLEARY